MKKKEMMTDAVIGICLLLLVWGFWGWHKVREHKAHEVTFESLGGL